MRRCQRTLDSGFLQKICTVTEANALRARDEFHALDNSLKDFILRYSNGMTEISALLEGIGSQVKSEFSQVRIDQERKRLLGSIKYPGMNERRNSISQHHKDTFKWIFPNQKDQTDDDDQRKPRWDSFTDWMQSDDHIYWISGKPGSGKSTLMAFLIKHPHTIAALEGWNPNSRIISHFFWSAGQSMQKSFKGLLCSLLHQLLSEDNFLASSYLSSFPEAGQKDSDTDWSEHELEDALFHAISLSNKLICIFIDGLDEITDADGYPKLLGFLSALERVQNIKLCVQSSRTGFAGEIGSILQAASPGSDKKRHPPLRYVDFTALLFLHVLPRKYVLSAPRVHRRPL
ncbi:hypothetical protein B0T24DRAFT_97015 [Lasiosphaeria ovina]|uniref:Nephrocystin 3-like N-terminal domain-containing protein n=1 Tax=Lasiosphaeria ovina TaxID=92902 RepID=A0AAE0JU56_9PEZI|nr:hypothetical protein B0T24DRAFT_97015 [Lasiosphaeria ovina]